MFTYDIVKLYIFLRLVLAGICGQVVKVVDFKPLATYRCAFPREYGFFM
jgi:hypothetical protein